MTGDMVRFLDDCEFMVRDGEILEVRAGDPGWVVRRGSVLGVDLLLVRLAGGEFVTVAPCEVEEAGHEAG